MTTIYADHALLPEGWRHGVRITLANTTIAALAHECRREAGDIAVEIALPGIGNLHSHAFQRAMAGLAETRGPGADSFWSWREQMYRFALSMTPDDVEAVAAALYIEMLEAGFTRVGEFHYLHHDVDGRPYADLAEMAGRIAAASVEAGIGLTLLPVLYAHGGFGGLAPGEGQRRFLCSDDRFARLVAESAARLAGIPGAVLGIAPHSLRAVTPKQLAFAHALAAGRPLHLHIAEQVREVEDCLAWCGLRPVEWLLENAPVDAAWCLIHATHMTLAETARVAAAGAVAGLCPITEANLGDGCFRGGEFRAAGGRFGIGSDSNVEISLSGELRMLEYSQRLGNRARNVMADPGRSTGLCLFEAAARGGNRALGAGAGGLIVGGAADFLSLTAIAPSVRDLPPDRWLDAFIFAPGHVAVDRVFVRGVQQVEGGRHRRRDTIAARFGRTMRKLLQ